jgi:hypothetical protein
LPLDVRLIAVAPRIERGEFQIDMIVNAKRPEHLSVFLEALQNTGSFYDMLASEQQRNEDGRTTPPCPVHRSSAPGVALAQRQTHEPARRASGAVRSCPVFWWRTSAAGVVWPLQQSGRIGTAHDRAELNLLSARKAEKDTINQRVSKTRADQELRKFYSEVLPKDFAAARNLTNFWLGRIAEQSRLTYRAGQYESEAVRGSQLMRLKGEITLVGDYADIRRFLYEVETAQEFVIIEKVALSQPTATQGGTLVELAVSVPTYFVPAGQTGAVSRGGCSRRSDPNAAACADDRGPGRAGAAYLAMDRAPALVIPTSTGPQATPTPVKPRPRPAGASSRQGSSAASSVPSMPQPLKLTEMEEQLPEEPKAERNLFRYGVPPPPPQPKYVPPPPRRPRRDHRRGRRQFRSS